MDEKTYGSSYSTDTDLEREGRNKLDEAKERMNQLKDRLVTFVKDRPTVSLLGAVAIGFVVGRLISRR